MKATFAASAILCSLVLVALGAANLFPSISGNQNNIHTFGLDALTINSVGAARSRNADETFGSVSTSEEAPIIITRAAPAVSAPHVDNASAPSPMVPAAAIKTHAELSSFAEIKFSSDENIAGLLLSPRSVSITYSEPARLLGILPFSLLAHAIVRDNGSIEVLYPWYGYLFSTNETELQAALESTIRGALSRVYQSEAQGSIAAIAPFSISAQAVLLDALHQTMKVQTQASVDASASAVARTRVY